MHFIYRELSSESQYKNYLYNNHFSINTYKDYDKYLFLDIIILTVFNNTAATQQKIPFSWRVFETFYFLSSFKNKDNGAPKLFLTRFFAWANFKEFGHE